MTMPGSTGIDLKPRAADARRSPRHSSLRHECDDQGLPGRNRRLLHLPSGRGFPCGYLPALAGDLKKQSFAEIWNHSVVFGQLRDDDNLKGKCGCCEFRHVCMGCRARAYAATGDFLAEEPFCVYEPKSAALKEKIIIRPRKSRAKSQVPRAAAPWLKLNL